MTASTTRSSASVLRLLAVAALCLALAAQASLEIRRSVLSLGEEGYQLSAEMLVELNPTLEEVVSRGVPLYFVAEFEITRPRWYWFDEKIASRSLAYRLSYHALTRQYRVATGPLHQNFPTLEEALGVISRIRAWQVAERSALRDGERYEAALRMRLDLAQLPKPIQVTAIGSREWNLGTDWQRWSFTAGREPR